MSESHKVVRLFTGIPNPMIIHDLGVCDVDLCVFCSEPWFKALAKTEPAKVRSLHQGVLIHPKHRLRPGCKL